MLLGPAALCSEAEPFKQHLYLLDFVLKQVKGLVWSPASQPRGVQNRVWTMSCLSLLELVKMRYWLKSTLKVASAVRFTVLTCLVTGERLFLALLATHVIEMKRLQFTQESGLL